MPIAFLCCVARGLKKNLDVGQRQLADMRETWQKLFSSFGCRSLIPRAMQTPPYGAERRHQHWLTCNRGEGTALQPSPRPTIQSILTTRHLGRDPAAARKGTGRKASKKQERKKQIILAMCTRASKSSLPNHGLRGTGDVNSCRGRNIPDCPAGAESWNACPRRQAPPTLSSVTVASC